jgi:hypothetical protein
MKRLMIATAALIAMGTFAHADTIVLPKECLEPISSEFSTGNGDSAFFQVEVMCRTGDRAWRIYTAEKFSAGGFLGMGRMSQPASIRIIIGEHSGKAQWKDN